MDDIILTSEELLNVIVSLQTTLLNNNLHEEDRTKHKLLIEKIKKIYSSILISEVSSVFPESDNGNEADEFDDEEYIFKDVDALVDESDILDDGDPTKKIKVKFSLIKDNDSSFVVCVETKGGEVLETMVRSFKLNKDELLLFENLKDKEALFKVILLQNGEPN